MCRLFALRANQPTHVRESLLSSPCSLRVQSCGDRRGVCHENGWGIGYYVAGQPVCEKSGNAARADPRYRAVAEAVSAPTVLAHVRAASVGDVAERNTHPFMHGPWLFAHNGTLQGFAQDPERLRRLIPAPLRACVQGDTDSEHAFYFVLGRLERVAGDGPARAEVVAGVVADALRTLAELFPGEGAEQTQINFALTDGRVLVASRWGHTLFWREWRGEAADDHALAVASEPTTTEPGWSEVPERSVLRVEADLTHAITPLVG